MNVFINDQEQEFLQVPQRFSVADHFPVVCFMSMSCDIDRICLQRSWQRLQENRTGLSRRSTLNIAAYWWNCWPFELLQTDSIMLLRFLLIY